MAITANCSKFLFYSKQLGANFNQTLMLGRLNLYASQKDIKEQIEFFGNNAKRVEDVVFKDEYSEPLFEILGATKTDSVDYSDYEKPTFVHDFNQPVPDALKNSYTAIVDGGTIEHIFNFPVAIRNCMELLKPGGHFIGITPVNNLMGHGFYQFSPELFYAVFNEANGFEIEKMVICSKTGEHSFSDWYEVVKPKHAKSRMELCNDAPTYLMVLAKKMKTTELFTKTPQQSDYETVWTASKSLENNEVAPHESRLHFLYRKFTPRPLRALLYNTKKLFSTSKVKVEGLGEINPDHYKKVDLKPVITAK